MQILKDWKKNYSYQIHFDLISLSSFRQVTCFIIKVTPLYIWFIQLHNRDKGTRKIYKFQRWSTIFPRTPTSEYIWDMTDVHWVQEVVCFRVKCFHSRHPKLENSMGQNYWTPNDFLIEPSKLGPIFYKIKYFKISNCDTLMKTGQVVTKQSVLFILLMLMIPLVIKGCKNDTQFLKSWKMKKLK